MTDEIMTTEQVAEMLQVSETTLKRWRSEGDGPPWFPLSSGTRAAIRYSRHAIDAWVKTSHEAQQGPDEAQEAHEDAQRWGDGDE